MGIHREKFEEVFARKKSEVGAKVDTDLDSRALKDLVIRMKAIVTKETGRSFPEDPIEQLRMAINAVFTSWYGARAVTYRRLYNIPDSWGPPSASWPWSSEYGQYERYRRLIYARSCLRGTQVFGEFL